MNTRRKNLTRRNVGSRRRRACEKRYQTRITEDPEVI